MRKQFWKGIKVWWKQWAKDNIVDTYPYAESGLPPMMKDDKMSFYKKEK